MLSKKLISRHRWEAQGDQLECIMSLKILTEEVIKLLCKKCILLAKGRVTVPGGVDVQTCVGLCTLHE